ncbi:MAG: queuosine salvage family protein [Myxococcota bacterium]
MAGLFDQIRVRCKEVTRLAASVRIDDANLLAFAERCAAQQATEESLDPARDLDADERESLAFVVALDAINFGSGWFPLLRKRPGMSGYRTIAAACRERFESHGAWAGEALRSTTPEAMAKLLEQDLRDRGVAELMGLYARAWQDLGAWLATEHDDCFESFVAAAQNSAEAMVFSLVKMPFYRDVASYRGLSVPFYKRAQITVADLSHTFGASGIGRFEDLDRLTLFADNLVPHVLRCEGVLSYAKSLGDRIDAEENLVSGSPEEVEIRAVAVEAVERLVAEIGRLGHPTTASALDGMLWNAGQASSIKARPRHRTRTVFY